MKRICQGPECHTYQTQSRIRGPKGNKVLRTRNARYDSEDNQWGYKWERYFCDERCLQDWLSKHMTQLINFIGIVNKPSETPVEIIKETKQGWRGEYVDTTINFLHTDLNNDNVTT